MDNVVGTSTGPQDSEASMEGFEDLVNNFDSYAKDLLAGTRRDRRRCTPGRLWLDVGAVRCQMVRTEVKAR